MQGILLTYIICICSFAALGQNSDMHVNVSGFKTDKGKCLLYLYNNKKGFPTDGEKAIKIINAGIAYGKATFTLKNMADGEYAITVIHDENDNGKLETNFLGMPKEGVGISNNAKGTMGPPRYEDARFILNKKPLTTSISITYL